jgi:hypothetical protein
MGTQPDPSGLSALLCSRVAHLATRTLGQRHLFLGGNFTAIRWILNAPPRPRHSPANFAPGHEYYAGMRHIGMYPLSPFLELHGGHTLLSTYHGGCEDLGALT